MRILHVFWNGEPGGRENLVYQIVKEQQGSPDLTAHVFLGERTGYYYDKLVTSGIPTFGLDEHKGLGKYVKCLSVMRTYDIIHFHSLNVGLMTLGVLSRRSIVFTLHGIRAKTTKTVFQFLFRKNNIVRGKQDDISVQSFSQNTLSAGKLHTPSSPAWRGLWRIGKRLYFRCFIQWASDRCFVNSTYLRNIATELYRVPDCVFSVVHNGISPSLLEPVPEKHVGRAQEGLAEDGFLIGTACRLVPVKRVDRLLRAFALVKQSNAIRNVALVIIGDGPMKDELVKLSQTLNIAQWVHWTGFRGDIASLRSMLDAFVISSSTGDTFPLTALEAMYVGVPTIVFRDSGGLPEIINHGQNGFIAEDEASLAKTLEDVALGKSSTTKITEQARQDVIGKYSIRSVAEAYYQSYREILTNQ